MGCLGYAYMARFQYWTLKRLRPIVWGFVASAVVGAVLHLISEVIRNSAVAQFLAMLGDAFLVGSIVALLIDLFASRSLIDDTARELSEKLIGAGLPRGLQTVISDIVHGTSIVWDRASVRYDIKQHPQDTGKVIIHSEWQYRVTNYGKHPKEYQPRTGDERFHPVRFLSFDGVFGNEPYHLGEDRLTVETWPGSGGPYVVGRKVTLPPYSPGDTDHKPYTVTWRVELILPSDYSEVIAFGAPTVGPFEIRKGDMPGDFEFHATVEDGTTVVAEGGNIWRYNRAFLPGQHLRVWWRPNALSNGP